jgi:hypothetical protein
MNAGVNLRGAWRHAQAGGWQGGNCELPGVRHVKVIGACLAISWTITWWTSRAKSITPCSRSHHELTAGRARRMFRKR